MKCHTRGVGELISRIVVIATAKELGISVVAYSPLGRGFLTGSIKSPQDLARKQLFQCDIAVDI